MLTNYLKLAVKVLGRRKVFTAISLFGISFTLVVLTVAVAMLDHTLSPTAPEVHLPRMMSIDMARMRGNGNTWQSPPGYKLIDEYTRHLPGVERMTVQTNGSLATSYLGGKKIESTMKYTDAEFWQVYQFDFVEGGPYGDSDVTEGRLVAVINQTTRQRFFGSEPATGRALDIDGQRLQVLGVVRDVPSLRTPSADVYAPLTAQKAQGWRDELLGNFRPVYVLAPNAQADAVRAELHERLKSFTPPSPQWTELQVPFEGRFDSMGRNLYPGGTDFTRSYRGFLLSLLVGGALLFMTLPAVNLVNINVSRIMERASEIGVRKAFGANSRTLVLQFVVENVALTLVGGAVGFVLAGFALRAINTSGLIPYAELALNGRIFAWGLLMAVAFGLMSGVYPAWRMSRMHPVDALRGGR
jgi:putative ABC transport system permease protein